MDQAAFFLILLSGAFDVSSSVPRYYTFVNAYKTWQEAQSYCRMNYIDLAIVESLGDITGMNNSIKSLLPVYDGPIWIGLKRSWGWSTGDTFDYTYTPWSSGQPNEETNESACALYHPTGWSDYYCSSQYYFYCLDDSPTASNRIIQISIAKTWLAAQTYCKQLYTDLAVINSSEDSAAFAGYSALAWIGLISSTWSDGKFSIFRNWAPGSSESSLTDKCGAMMAKTGTYISKDCSLKMPFICYAGPQPVTHKYHYVSFGSTWLKAQGFCRTVFTDLATIDTINDLNSIINEVDLGYSGSFWIGLTRGKPGQWGWSRGDARLAGYSNWDLGRPNGAGQCVANINNVWRDYDCTVPLYFVCYYEQNGYILVESNKTWLDAQSYCRSTYTDLATIRSPWEQKQLIKLVGRGVFVWIGLFLDTWQWSDQWSRFYRNWAVGQPSTTSGDCVAMSTSGSGKWTVQNCAAALPFICYGKDNPMKRKQIMRIKLSFSRTTNLNDPSMQAVILGEIKNKLRGQGMPADSRLSWKLTSDGNVFVKHRAIDKW